MIRGAGEKRLEDDDAAAQSPMLTEERWRELGSAPSLPLSATEERPPLREVRRDDAVKRDGFREML